MNFDATKFPELRERKLDNGLVEECINYNYDSFSTTSTNYSCSTISCSINDNELYIENNHGYSSHSWENVAVAAPSVNIGSITVQNGTDVTFGNKIVFNTPVEINHLVVNYGEPNVDALKNRNKTAERKLAWKARAQYYYSNHPCKVYSIISAIAVMVAAFLILVGYYFDPFENKTMCEELTSNPSFYACGFAKACTRCKAMFSHKEICRSHYDDSCGDLRCFCKPRCTPEDCQT
ncbi:uncharacterized protein LOC119073629 [Bradysia coprophila]|uniref:uncharacterized protein LOC119073629 n=1 Tax=Bradysia coprophila TaxID=38358 RepID=UPI00187D7C51|nr:uncharacterized protein LOC119073629 [Bradysia coprophila]